MICLPSRCSILFFFFFFFWLRAFHLVSCFFNIFILEANPPPIMFLIFKDILTSIFPTNLKHKFWNSFFISYSFNFIVKKFGSDLFSLSTFFPSIKIYMLSNPLDESKLSILIVSLLQLTISSFIKYFLEYFGIAVFILSSEWKFTRIWQYGSANFINIY